MFSLDVQDWVLFLQTNSLSKSDDFKIIPPPSTAALLPTVLSDCIASSIFLSSTLKFCVSMLVVVPVTINCPSTLTSPPTCKGCYGCDLNIPTLDRSVSTTIAST